MCSGALVGIKDCGANIGVVHARVVGDDGIELGLGEGPIVPALYTISLDPIEELVWLMLLKLFLC